MKVFLNDKVYVQRMDLIYVMNYIDRTKVKVPQIVLDVSFKKTFVDTNESNYLFYSFEDEETINFFENQLWCVDYDFINKYTDDELRKMNQDLIDQRRKISKKYSKNTENDNLYIDLNGFYKKEFIELCYLNISIRNILFLRLGFLNFPMPKEEKKSKNILKKILKNK